MKAMQNKSYELHAIIKRLRIQKIIPKSRLQNILKLMFQHIRIMNWQGEHLILKDLESWLSYMV